MDRWMGELAPQLRALDELAAHEAHMTRAADSLGIPQSSMSRRIHALEKTLGLRLLIQDGRTVRLTPAAVRLVDRARGPLHALEAAVEAIAGEADAQHGTVRFGFPLTMGSGRLPTLIAEFRRRAPGIRLQIKQAHGTQLTSDLKSGELDVAVMIPASDEVRHQVIGAQSILAVLPVRHRLAGRKRLRLKELHDEAFIANPMSYNLRQLTESWCAEAGFTPKIAVELTEFATMHELIGRGLGIALLPHDERSAPDIVEIALSPSSYRREIALAWSPTAATPASRRLLAFIRDQFASRSA